MELRTFIATAIIIEALISWGSTLFVDKHFQPKVLVALILGIGLTIDLNINMFAMVGLEETYPLVGQLLTGVFVSRGSNYVYELINKLTNWKAIDVNE